ncbi:hypothetical protein Thermus77420_04390 [Thermus thalpophilus]
MGIGGEALGVHGIGHKAKFAWMSSLTFQETPVPLLGNYGGKVTKEVREPISKVGGALGAEGPAHFKGVVSGTHYSWNRGQEADQPGQKVGVDHVGMHHLGLKFPNQANQPPNTNKAGPTPRHT